MSGERGDILCVAFITTFISEMVTLNINNNTDLLVGFPPPFTSLRPTANFTLIEKSISRTLEFGMMRQMTNTL